MRKGNGYKRARKERKFANRERKAAKVQYVAKGKEGGMK